MNNLHQELNLYTAEPNYAFENQLHNIIGKLFGEEVTTVVCDGTFALPLSDHDPNQNSKQFVGADEQGLFILNSDAFATIEDNILEQHQLKLGTEIKTATREWIARDKEYAAKIFIFKKELLVIEQEWINNYTKYVKDLLSNRISEGVPIIQHEAIRLMWADLIEKITSLEKTINCLMPPSPNTTPTNTFAQARILIREACEILAKLAGGRAFLLGQAVNMLWLFDIVNNIYFAEEVYGE